MTAKKKIIIALCSVVAVVAIVIATVASTVAYLTSSAAVLNAFTIGNVQMTMFESKVNSDGTKVNPDSPVKNADTNSYHLVCNKSYVKDPTIYIQPNSESSYLFIVARNDIRDIEDYNTPSMREQLFLNGWREFSSAATGKVYVYTGALEGADKTAAEAAVKAYNDAIKDAEDNDSPLTVEQKKANATTRATTLKNICDRRLAVGVKTTDAVKEINLFAEFSVAADADLSKYGGAEVKVTAVAIQTAGFAEDEDEGTQNAINEAWAAVMATYPYIYG